MREDFDPAFDMPTTSEEALAVIEALSISGSMLFSRKRAAQCAVLLKEKFGPQHCQCEACRDGTIHASDCAVHNEPAYPKGPCDCDAGKVSDAVALAFHNAISDSPINADEMAELKVGLKAALAIARQEQTRKRANVAEPSEYAKAFEAGRKSVLMWIDPSIKAEIDAAQQRAIHAAAKAVERSATVWEGFSYQDAKLCIDMYLRAAQAGK